MFEWYVLCLALLVIFSIAMHSLIIGISPMPSSKKVAKEILNLAKKSNHSTLIDLGSGFGSLSIYLAVNLPSKKVIGYERSFFPWLISVFLKHLLGVENLVLYRRNFLNEQLSDVLLVCYLFPAGMQALEDKLKKENKGFELISSTFAFRNIKITQQIQVQDLYLTPVYYYLDVSDVYKTS